jgi:4-oxalocrotonate tautomerase
MISRVTEAMIAVEGEAMRSVTWVRLNEVDNWAVGGKLLNRDIVLAEMSSTLEAAI